MDKVLMEDQISQVYDGRRLMEIYTHFFKDFLAGNHGFFKKYKLDHQSFSRMIVSKKQLIRLLGGIFSDAPLLSQWLETCPEKAYQALYIVVWEGEQEVGTLEKKIGCSILMSAQSKEKRPPQAIKTEFCLLQGRYFKSFWGAEGSVYYLDLPSTLKQQLKPFLPVPSGLTLLETGTPSFGFVFEDQGRVLDVLPTICSFIQQDQLERTQQGNPRTKSILQLRSVCGVTEFYNQQQGSDLNCLRTSLMVHLLQITGVEAVSEDAPLFLKTVFERYLNTRTYPHLSLLSHIRGLYHSRDAVNHRLHHTTWNLLCSLPDGQWITFEQLCSFAGIQQMDLEPVLKKSADRYLYLTKKWQGWGNKKMYLTPARYEQALVIPLLKASLFLFGSFGLLDLAYDVPETSLKTGVDNPYQTIYDGLISVRLTELGAYITGRRSTLDYARQKKSDVEFNLDVDRLFITYSRPDSLIELSLDRFAKRIGSMRYKVDYSSFLKGCRNKQEVQKKIQLFKDEIGDYLPPLWQNFFESVLARAEVLQPVNDLLVYRISTHDRDLLEIIKKDRIIQNYILKAERHNILVRAEDREPLKNRLEELGYLM